MVCYWCAYAYVYYDVTSYYVYVLLEVLLEVPSVTHQPLGPGLVEPRLHRILTRLEHVLYYVLHNTKSPQWERNTLES